MLLKLYVDGLIVLYVHQVEWGTALADHLKVVHMRGIVEAYKIAVIDAKSVTPEMKDAFLDRPIAARRCGGIGVWEWATLNTVTAQSLTAAAETVGRLRSRTAFRALCVSGYCPHQHW